MSLTIKLLICITHWPMSVQNAARGRSVRVP
jgi:hypothetical protein